MHRIDGSGATADNRFTEGDAATGVPATEVTDDWLNATQEEIVAAIEGMGVVLDKANNAQLLEALKRIASRKVTSVAGVSGGTTQSLTIAEAGLVLVDATNGAVTLNLPAASGNDGLRYTVVRVDSSANTVSVTPDGTDTIDGAASLDLVAGDRRTLECDGASDWKRTMTPLANPTQAGDHQNDTHALTAASLIAGVLGAGGTGSSDYISLPFRDKTTGELRHLIVQWGAETSSSTGPVKVNFPIAFPSACLRVLLTTAGGNADTAYITGGQVAATASSFDLNTYSHDGTRVTATSGYIAIGI